MYPWPFDPLLNIINDKGGIDRQKEIQSFVPIAFKQEQYLDAIWLILESITYFINFNLFISVLHYCIFALCY